MGHLVIIPDIFYVSLKSKNDGICTLLMNGIPYSMKLGKQSENLVSANEKNHAFL